MKKTLITILFAAIAIPSFSQSDETVYVYTNRGPRKQREYKTVDFDNVYKFDVVQMMTGQILFGFEHRLAPKTTMEIELGPNISNVGINVGHINSSNSNGESVLGVSSSAAIRYYPGDEKNAPNGFYVSPKFAFRNYNYYEQAVNSNGVPVGDKIKGYENNFRFMMMMGKQYWLSSTFSLDVYCGLGLGQLSSKRTMATYEYNYQTQQYETVTSTKFDTDASVVFECGLKLGIGN